MAQWSEVGGRAARVWTVALAIAFAVVGLVNRDVEAIAFAVVWVIGAALTKIRKGLLGRVVLFVAAVDTLVWMAPAALINAREGERVADVAVPVLLAVLALAIVLLALGVPPAPVLVAAVVLLAAGIAGSVTQGGDGPVADADARISIRNVKFSPEDVSVPADGTISVRNPELFWHTFTVEELDIDVRIPTGATRIVDLAARDVEPGQYEFTCVIPGHESRMRGTLTVED